MHIRHYLAASVAAISFVPFSAAYAQSTGSVEFEEEIVVTGTTAQDVAGVQAPDSPKAKAVLTQEFIARQNPGQTILDTINQIPAVNFQNNDAYGSSGGTLNIRGFGGDRISLTFDGIPLNDSGNYAIYSNQQLDPELIEQVNVNLGATDVDSPTASAVGGTVNYRTRTPSEEFGVRFSGSAGEFDFFRVFGMVDTGVITPWGTRMFLAASTASNKNPFNNYGRVRKQQYNGRIYQPIGDNGDFISVSAHYNQNRNNFFGSLPLRNDRFRVNGAVVVPRNPGSGSNDRFPANADEREYRIDYPCNVNTVARAGLADTPNSCGTEFDRRYNPSNTGNVRVNSRFSLTDTLTLTVDPSFQYVKANGGGTVGARERGLDINPTGGAANCTTVTTGTGVNCAPGYLGGRPYFGRDVNGDGDILDEITMIAPSQTQTRRWGVIANLRWEINDLNSVRLSYTFDRARHRQTGEVGAVDIGGEPLDVFPVNFPLRDASGAVLQKRDRLSIALLNQVAAQYRGEWFDEKLVVDIGVRAPFFKRELNQNCFTTSASGFVDCFGTNTALAATYAALNPTARPPQQRIYKYNKVLPNLGLVYRITPQFSLFGSYAQGLSVPGTDPLYNSIFFPANNPATRPAPETTDSFDLGVRYRSSKIQAQLTGWLTKYQNRLASAFDPDLNETVFRNLGSVDKWGIDGSISWAPIPEATVYLFGAWNDSEIKRDVQVSATTFAPTAGKREAGSPTWSFGGTLRGSIGPFDLGLTAKRTGPRYIYDTNLPVYGRVPTSETSTVLTTQEIFGAKAPAYTLVNLDARFSLEAVGLNDKSYFQLNVYNLFDSFYQGGFGGGLFQSGVLQLNPTGTTFGSPPFVQIGAPRTISGTLSVAF